MAAISRKEIEELKDTLISNRKRRGADLVGYFLHLFENGKPLQKEAVQDWQDTPPDGVPAEHIKQCLKEALEEKFVEERGGEFFITEAGKEKAEEVIPIGPSIG